MCNADRRGGRLGVCMSGYEPVISHVGLHKWEEPCISGVDEKRGSGTVFFGGCSLRCSYCQNHSISFKPQGKKMSLEELHLAIEGLIDNGAYNINFVTPTHYSYVIEELNRVYGHPSVPVVYNTGGYERISTLKSLEGAVDVFLTDIKYASDKLSERYSRAKDYPQRALDAAREMCKTVGDYRINNDGIMERGVIIRHLVLPGCARDSMRVMELIAQEILPIARVKVSIMSQYIPVVKNLPDELNRKIKAIEYKAVCAHALKCSIPSEDIYVQELDSATSQYIPVFNMADKNI